jgi:hypothetical protein
MTILRDGTMAMLDSLRRRRLNSDGTYVDLWLVGPMSYHQRNSLGKCDAYVGFAESQERAGILPCSRICLPYQLPILERFG